MYCNIHFAEKERDGAVSACQFLRNGGPTKNSLNSILTGISKNRLTKKLLLEILSGILKNALTKKQIWWFLSGILPKNSAPPGIRQFTHLVEFALNDPLSQLFHNFLSVTYSAESSTKKPVS